MRQSVERCAIADAAAWPSRLAVMREELLELVAAIDRRVPQPGRTGEASIANDAAALRARALDRIAEFELQSSSVESP